MYKITPEEVLSVSGEPLVIQLNNVWIKNNVNWMNKERKLHIDVGLYFKIFNSLDEDIFNSKDKDFYKKCKYNSFIIKENIIRATLSNDFDFKTKNTFVKSLVLECSEIRRTRFYGLYIKCIFLELIDGSIGIYKCPTFEFEEEQDEYEDSGDNETITKTIVPFDTKTIVGFFKKIF
jgi:hypothetical protein